jgi:hypothetical protein
MSDIHALARTLSWTVNILLIQKVKDLEIRKWYMRACIEQGWGRDFLALWNACPVKFAIATACPVASENGTGTQRISPG